MATLLVVRFAGTGMREYHDLGLCIPATDDDTVRVIYADLYRSRPRYLCS